MHEITVQRLERALDRVAELTVDLEEGHLCVPIYERLKAELENLEAREMLMEEIRERARLSKQKRRGTQGRQNG